MPAQQVALIGTFCWPLKTLRTFPHSKSPFAQRIRIFSREPFKEPPTVTTLLQQEMLQIAPSKASLS